MRKIAGIATGILMQLSVVSQQVEIREPVRFLALGDSYTIGQSVADSLSWPLQLYDSLEVEGFTLEELQIIARTGWRTDNLATAIYDARLREDYNLVSLLIGVNDQYQGVPIENYPAAFTGLLEEAIELAGGRTSGVFVLSIPAFIPAANVCVEK
jgi:hypothetical protein